MSVSRQMETKKKQIGVDKIIIDSYLKNFFLYEMKNFSFSNIKHQWIIGIFHIYSLVYRDNISIDYWNLCSCVFPWKQIYLGEMSYLVDDIHLILEKYHQRHFSGKKMNDILINSTKGDQCFKMVDGKRKILNVIFFLAINSHYVEIIHKFFLELNENNLKWTFSIVL